MNAYLEILGSGAYCSGKAIRESLIYSAIKVKTANKMEGELLELGFI